MRQARLTGTLLVTCALAVTVIGLLQAQQIHRNGFETRQPAWIKGAGDAPFRELVHEVTDAMARTGQYCEHIQVNAEHF